MALTTTISTRELQRIAATCYEGKQIRVSLANDTSAGYTVEDPTINWDSIKVSGNGYSDFTAVVGTGEFDPSDSRYEMGVDSGSNTYIDAEFSATGAGYVFNRVYVVVGTLEGETVTEEGYLHSLLTEAPSVTLSAGSVVTYRIQLAVA